MRAIMYIEISSIYYLFRTTSDNQLYNKISKYQMIQKLLGQKSIMESLFTEYESSCDSLFFIRSQLQNCLYNVKADLHKRKPQINTMATPSGIDFRKTVINMHTNLITNLTNSLADYSTISDQGLKNIHNIREVLREANYCITNFQQEKRFLTNKLNRAKEEILHLQNLEVEWQKKNHYENLKKQLYLGQKPARMEIFPELDPIYIKSRKQKCSRQHLQVKNEIDRAENYYNMKATQIFNLCKLRQNQLLDCGGEGSQKIRKEQRRNKSQTKSWVKMSLDEKVKYRPFREDSTPRQLSSIKQVEQSNKTEKSEEMLLF